MSKILYYALCPVLENTAQNRIATAAVATCMATGKLLSSSGGGGDFLSKDIVDALRAGGKGRAYAIIDGALLDEVMTIVKQSTSPEAKAVAAKLLDAKHIK